MKPSTHTEIQIAIGEILDFRNQNRTFTDILSQMKIRFQPFKQKVFCFPLYPLETR